MSDLTLYFLQASRSIRTAWLLEELGLDYKLEFAERENGIASQSFKEKSGDALGKFPYLLDGELGIAESGAQAEYLCETYDKSHRLMPSDPAKHVAALRWVHAAEGTYALHGLAILYARWFGAGHDEAQKAIEEGLSKNVGKDIDFLEAELNKAGTKFLLGDHPTVADTMMQFSIVFIFARKLGTQDRTWPRVEQWLKDCESSDGYVRAVKKTGHKL